MTKYIFPSLFLAALLSLPVGAMAQSTVPDSATRAADPGRIQQQLLDQDRLPDVSESLEIEPQLLQGLPDNAAEITFVLSEVIIEDASQYSPEELAPYYRDMIGQEISLADFYGIAAALTNKYRNDGYILSQVIVPPQTIDGGVVRLRVIEGFLNNVIIEGDINDESTLKLIRLYTKTIEVSDALNVADLERALLLINDLPGISARSVLSASENAAGGTDLRLLIEQQLYEAVVGLDNLGTRYLGPLQVNGSVSFNNIFKNAERVTAQLAFSPDPGTNDSLNSELGYVALSYDQPLNLWGHAATLNVLASHTDTEPGFDLVEFDVEGISQYARVRLTHPLIRSRSDNLNIYGTFDWRNVQSRSNIQETLRDNIRAVRAGGTYEFLDQLFGVAANAVAFEVSQGVNVLGASQKGDDNITRGSGDPQFWKVTGDFQRLQRLTPELNILVAGTGQWSNNALLSSEEFGVGGSSFGRGYDGSEIVGDQGFAGKVEVQWREPYKIDALDTYQLFGFYDAGRVFNQDPTTNDQKKDTLTSTGFGIRTEFMDDIEADAYVAFPLNREVQTAGDESARFFFSVSKSF